MAERGSRIADVALVGLIGSDDCRVPIAGLKITDEVFRVVGSELTTILPDIVPSLAEPAELAEDTHGSVDAVARETIANMQSNIGEGIATYFR